MDPARVVTGLVVVALAIATLAFPERALRYVEGTPPRRVASVARFGAGVTAFVGLSLVFGL
ncbi:MAG: hypothetical protein ABEJ05_06320 [Haloglomus sp.]